MTNAVIGALRVDLGINSANFQTGMKGAQTSMAKFASHMKVVAAGAAAAFAGISAGLVKAAGRADDMGKAAQSLGIGVEELSKLQHAADLSGVSFETLQTGIRRLSQTMAEALSGGSSSAAKSLAAMGVTVKDAQGNMRSTSEVMADLADRFAAMPAGAQKTAAAVELFGRSGAAMIPMLNGGSAGLKDMGDQAERLGLVINQRTATASERFNDNLTLLARSMDGVFNKVLADVAPAFENLSFRLMDAVHGSGALDTISKTLAGTMNLVARGVTVAFDNLRHFYDLLKIYVAAKAVTYTVAMAGAFIQMAKAIRVAGLTAAAFTTITRAKITTLALLAAVIAKATGTYDGFVAKLKDVGGAVMNALPDSMRQGFESLSAKLDQVTGNLGDLDNEVAKNLSTYLGVANDGAESFGTVGAKARSAATSATDAWAGLRDVTADTTRQMNQAEMAGESFGQTLASSLQGLFDGSKKFSDVLKDIASQLANMALSNALKGIFGGLFGGASGGGFLSSIFGGFRAMGGPVAAGRAYVVGERGPELVVPSSSGTVIPNSDLQGSDRAGVNADIRVWVDQDGNWQAAVQNIADGRVVSGIKEYDRSMPERLGGHLTKLRRIGAI